jgi:hypothetical protein
MKVVVPYTKPPVVDFGEHHYVGDSDFDYWYLIVRLWEEGQPFILVEHDIRPATEQIDELAECPESLCAFEYPYKGSQLWSLGCTKFGQKCLDFKIQCETRSSVLNYGPPAPFWGDVCSCLLSQIQNSGIKAHVHEGTVEHLCHQ